MTVQTSINVTYMCISECVMDISRSTLQILIAVLFGTRAQCEVSTEDDLNVTAAVMPFSDSVKLLGVTLDSWSDDGLAHHWSSTTTCVHCITSALC